MATHCIPQLTFRFHRNSKLVVAVFDMTHASSDGGALQLKTTDAQWGLTQRLATCLDDPRSRARFGIRRSSPSGSRSCITDWRWTGSVARGFSPISCASC